MMLNDLAIKFLSDKASSGNDYMPLYEEYFKQCNLKRTNVSNILEIGTNKGSSLRVWAEYFTNANVHGIDITRQYEMKDLLNHSRIYTHILDQGNRNDLMHFTNQFDKFDIIIDDGSHDQKDQQISFGMLFQKLIPGGLYIIEDLITGQPWFNGDIYNKSKIRPTRTIIQELEQVGRLKSSVMTTEEINYIENNYSFAVYKESKAIVYHQHHPEICFIGHK